MGSEWDDVPLRHVLADGALVCPLEQAALELARQEYPDLAVPACLEQIDAMAALARPMLSVQPDAAETLGVVNDVLFRDLGFRGNTAHYDDPRNSFLNQVLVRRRGIPISLSVLYLAVARRLGLVLHGTRFPGHFLLRYDRPAGPLILDAFDRGRIGSLAECRERLRPLGIAWDDAFLDPVSDIDILRRMLENLKRIYLRAHDWRRLLRTTSQILALVPEDHDERFTHGIALAGIGELQRAATELERYLEMRPAAANRAEVLQMLEEIRRRA